MKGEQTVTVTIDAVTSAVMTCAIAAQLTNDPEKKAAYEAAGKRLNDEAQRDQTRQNLYEQGNREAERAAQMFERLFL